MSTTVYDQNYSRQYRQSDEAEVATDNHRRVCEILGGLCDSIGRPLDVLDVGCGTGRYFHCLRNVRRLVGVDPSADMLKEAGAPVRADRISIATTELVTGDAGNLSFPPASFDFIYSIGTLGEHAPFDRETLRRLLTLLRPGGALFFSVVDRDSKPVQKGWKRRVIETLWFLVPPSAQTRLKDRWRSNYLTRPELEGILRQGGSPFDIRFEPSRTPRWIGAHFECTVRKSN